MRQAYKNAKESIVILTNILALYESYEVCELKQVTALIPKIIFSLVLNQNVQHSSSDMKSPKKHAYLKVWHSFINLSLQGIHTLFLKSKFRVENLIKIK